MIKKSILLAPRVEKKLKSLPSEIREKFYGQLSRLLENPSHPSLRHKRVRGTLTDWEFSITMNYRALYRIEGNSLIILIVGKHEDVF